MIKTYVKKPVVIEAVRWTGDNIDEIIKFCGDSLTFKGSKPSRIYINTLEGRCLCSPHDYIIKGVDYGFYPCKSDVFKQIYEEVE